MVSDLTDNEVPEMNITLIKMSLCFNQIIVFFLLRCIQQVQELFHKGKSQQHTHFIQIFRCVEMRK